MALETLANQQKYRPNPAFAPLFSWQGAKNMAGELGKGALAGGLGGTAVGLGGAAYGGFQAAQQAAQQAGTAAPSFLQWAAKAGPEAAKSAYNTGASWLDKAGGLQSVAGGVQGLAGTVGALKGAFSPEQQMQNMQEGVTNPVASSGPVAVSGSPTGGGPGGYFSFDKYFGGQATSRGPIAEGAGGPGVTGMAPNQPETNPGPGAEATVGQQEELPMEQWGAPESGWRKYVYNASDWLNKQNWLHAGLGGLASLGTTLGTGGLGFFAAPAAGAAAGAASRGLTAGLRNFFAVRQEPEFKAQQQLQPAMA